MVTGKLLIGSASAPPAAPPTRAAPNNTCSSRRDEALVDFRIEIFDLLLFIHPSAFLKIASPRGPRRPWFHERAQTNPDRRLSTPPACSQDAPHHLGRRPVLAHQNMPARLPPNKRRGHEQPR